MPQLFRAIPVAAMAGLGLAAVLTADNVIYTDNYGPLWKDYWDNYADTTYVYDGTKSLRRGNGDQNAPRLLTLDPAGIPLGEGGVTFEFYANVPQASGSDTSGIAYVRVTLIGGERAEFHPNRGPGSIYVVDGTEHQGVSHIPLDNASSTWQKVSLDLSQPFYYWSSGWQADQLSPTDHITAIDIITASGSKGLYVDEARLVSEQNPDDGDPALLSKARMPMDRLYDNRLETESANYLSINLYNVPIDHTKAANPVNFTIISDDDPNYVSGLQPTASGSRTRAIRVARRKHLLVKHTAIFLELPVPMQADRSYTVQVGDVGTQNVPALEPVTFDDAERINDNIRVNQLGYLPDRPKVAYVGQYMGDLGPMPVNAAQFEVVNEWGSPVFSGPVIRRQVNEDRVGQNVYELDFSAFDTAGRYQLRVPGLGRSYAFEISPRAFNPVFANLMRGSYHQRCGIALDDSFTQFARQACHLDDAYLEQSVEGLAFLKPKNLPYHPTNYDGQLHACTYGHHDAGDYGKYIVNGAGYAYSILRACEIYPAKFVHDNLGLPTSGDGVPDLLQELKWELDWIENMQDVDGGVFGIIKPRNGGYENSLPLADPRRLYYPKDRTYAAVFAATLAAASRSSLVQQYYPNDGARYLQKAIAAWNWLEQNSRYVAYHHYGDLFKADIDEVAWAAVELYAATGEAEYHDYFLDHIDLDESNASMYRRWSWWGLFEAQGYATMTYAFLGKAADPNRPVDPAMHQRCVDEVLAMANKYINDADNDPYRLSISAQTVNHGNYGWLFPGDMYAYNLVMAYALDPDPLYLKCALHNLNYTLGTNPHGYVLQTGIGYKRNIEAVDNESTFDGIIQPVPGLPLGIGTNGFYFLNQYGSSVDDDVYPNGSNNTASWPLLNRWYDGFNVQSEFVSPQLIREAIAYGFFADMGSSPNQSPTIDIQGDLVGPAPHTVEFSANASDPDGRVLQYFWSFDDEQFSSQADPVHVFTDPGRTYDVTLTVIDDHGNQAHQTVTVGALPEAPAYPQQPHEPDADTFLLCHFDGDLSDASGNGLGLQLTQEIQGRQPPIYVPNPLWMSSPQGACLRLDGAERLTVSLPRSFIDPDGMRHQPLTLEMMVYIEQWAGYAFPNPLLMGAEEGWNSYLAWRESTWPPSGQPRAPYVAGYDVGTFIPASVFENDFPLNQWVHVKLTYDGAGTATFYVNEELWGQASGDIFGGPRGTAVPLWFGPFDGMIDELRVSGSSDAGTASAPRLIHTTVNDGDPQRAMVASVTLAFDEAVTISSGAIVLARPDGGDVADVHLNVVDLLGDGTTHVVYFGGPGLSGGSLVDGVYDLKVDASRVRSLAGRTLQANAIYRFHRLYGDINGDKVVDNLDVVSFRSAWNDPAAYAHHWDHNNDGRIDNLDLVAFRERWNKVSFNY